MSSKTAVLTISRARFEALSYAKHPYAELTTHEVAWYSDSKENVLGAVVLDRIDEDWSIVVLGRDEASLFRAVDLQVSIPSLAAAKKLLRRKIQEHSRTGQTVFHQFDVKKRKNKIFELVVPNSRVCRHFKILADTDHHQAARGIIREIAYAFVDIDGNFAEQFQTDGFNARLWELFLYAFLHEQRFILKRDYPRPDFFVEKFGAKICIEAVTASANPKFDEPPPGTPEEIQRRLADYMPIKFGSPLHTKLRKEYWKLPHVGGSPLIFAIHDFHEESSMMWSSSALTSYLYGIRHTWTKDSAGKLQIKTIPIQMHRWKTKEIPSNFFAQPGAENISAVLFTNSATLSKFNRMGQLAGFGRKNVKMWRRGVYHHHDENATEPLKFFVEVDPKKYAENWTQGVSIFHNPNALYPVPPELFPGVAQHFFEDGRLVAILPEFFPYASRTIVTRFTKPTKRRRSVQT